MSGKYTFGKTVAMGFEQALERVTQELDKEGFGVLPEIDVAATLKKKLGKEIPPCTIRCEPIGAARGFDDDACGLPAEIGGRTGIRVGVGSFPLGGLDVRLRFRFCDGSRRGRRSSVSPRCD